MTHVLEHLADPEVLPRVTEVNRGHFEAAARERVAVRLCTDCRRLFHYPRPRCPTCHSPELVWHEVSGRGRVVVSSVVSRPPWNEMPRPTPYVVALAEPDEGPRMFSTVEGVEARNLPPGTPVKAVFERVGDLGIVRFTTA